MSNQLSSLAIRLKAFATERDWAQFHSPKNLATALAVEAGELLEHFQWLTEEQSRTLEPAARDAIALEMADVLLYLLQLSSALHIDLHAAALRKIEINQTKYPVDKAKGTSRKSNQL